MNIIGTALGIGKDIGLLLWNAYARRRKENKSFDLFRLLVKFMNDSPRKFIKNTIEPFIPHVIKNSTKEEKIKRKITRFFVDIPRVISEMQYNDVFPNLTAKKRKLLEKLYEYELMELQDIKNKFSKEVDEIGTEIKADEERTLDEISKDVKDFLSVNEPKIAIFTADPTPNVNIYHQRIDTIKQRYYGQSDINLDLNNEEQYYIDNYVTGVVSDYVPKPIYLNRPAEESDREGPWVVKWPEDNDENND